MVLPENGTVVIIDDKPNEALPIIMALSKRGISTTYYQGTKGDMLPGKPSQFVRLVFLDLQLLQAHSTSEQIARKAIDVLEHIIPRDNGPYILVIWSSKGTLYGSEVKRQIRNHNYLAPSCIIDISKSDCMEQRRTPLINDAELIDQVLESMKGRLDEEDESHLTNSIHQILDEKFSEEFVANTNAIDVIEKHIKKGLKKAGIFHLFVIWENLLRKAGGHSVQSISSAIDVSDLWEGNMRSVIRRLAKARLGKNELENSEVLKAALATFGSSFSEELELLIKRYKFPNYINSDAPFLIKAGEDGEFEISELVQERGSKYQLVKEGKPLGKASFDVNTLKAVSTDPNDTEVINGLVDTYLQIPYIINTKLHIEYTPSKQLMPGNVYKIKVAKKRKKELVSSYFKSINDINNYQLIELEVSPICDYAQSKWKKSRLISGVLYSEIENKSVNGDFLYLVEPTVLIDGVPHRLIFDYHLFKSKDKEDVEARTIWFRIKRELLMDIIAKLSGHVNRPGISFVN